MNKNFKMNLQLFAEKTPTRTYQLQYKDLVTAVFESRAYFRDFFGGTVEILDGVQENETAFYVKTSDIPVVIGNYDKGKNVAFGTGTGNSNRFGERTEVIYTNTPVPYTWDWAFHEGIDRHTVNLDLDEAVADRLDLLAQARINQMNKQHGTFISNAATKTLELENFTNESVLKLFNDLSNYFVNIEAIGKKVAKVSPELYNAIVDHPITTTAKHSTTNIDKNEIFKFKGFEIEEIPEAHLTEGAIAYVYVTEVGKAFIGINTARTIESEDFDGVALQGAGKAGEYIPEVNKKAVAKVELVPTA